MLPNTNRLEIVISYSELLDAVERYLVIASSAFAVATNIVDYLVYGQLLPHCSEFLAESRTV